MSDGGPGMGIDWDTILKRNAASNSTGLQTTAGPIGTPTGNHGMAPIVGGSGNPFNWQKVFDAAGNAASGMKPYLSNITNAMRKPPFPSLPGTISPVVLPKVSLDNSRNQIERSTRSADLTADKSLDEQTAAAVRNANLGTKIQGTNQVNQQEAAINAQQGAEAAQLNSNIDAMNTGTMNNYRDSLTSRQIAQQREQSANVANATDKSIAIDNEKRKGELDLKKLQVLSEVWKQSGVYDRMMAKMKKEGNTDPTGIISQMGNALGGKLKPVFANGGIIDPGKNTPVGTYKTQAQVNDANVEVKRFSTARNLGIGENAYVAKKPGDPIVPYTDGRTGQPYQPSSNIPKYNISTYIPPEITSLSFDTQAQLPYYEDPQSGDMKYTTMENFNLPRFKKPVAPISGSLASRAYGGKLKFKKVY